MNSSFYFSHTCFWFYCWSCCPASHRCMHFLIALSCCIITPAITLPSLSCYFVIPVVVLPFWWIVVCLRCSCCVAPATLLPQRWYHRVSPSCSLAFSSLSILCTHKSFRSLHHLPPCIVVYCHVCILTFDTLSNTEIKVIESPVHLYLWQVPVGYITAANTSWQQSLRVGYLLVLKGLFWAIHWQPWDLQQGKLVSVEKSS